MYRIGIDIGSTMTKVAVMDEAGEELLDTILRPTGFNSAVTATELRDELTARGYLDPAAEESVGDGAEAARIVATGYGRISVPYADKTVTEITCHGRGAVWLFEPDGTVIDVGGQDTKVIQLAGGRVKKFVMNDKCSAGTGKFLEVMADRMGVTQEELAKLAAQGQPITISSMCTVFAESEVISLVGQGTPKADIAHGVVESVVSRVCTLATQFPSEGYFLTGGLCENVYVVGRLSAALKAPVRTDPRARYAGAIGAALS